MKQAIKIDSNGYYIEPFILDNNVEITANLIETACPDGFYKPKWDGAQWIEGMTQTEFLAIPKPTPTVDDRITALESVQLSALGV